MGQGLRLGRVAGIPVHVHWSVAATVMIITAGLGGSVLPGAVPHQPPAVYWTAGVAAALLLVASVLPHELAHARMARRNGIGVRSIRLFVLGGVTELGGDPPDAGADLRIALAGPTASLSVAAFFAGAAAAIHYAAGPHVAAAAALWLAEMNGLLAVFNLLPGAPLDGGRVLRAVLWRRRGDRTRAELASARSGQVIGAAMIAAGTAGLLGWGNPYGPWLIALGLLLATVVRKPAGATAVGRLRTARPDAAAAPAPGSLTGGAGQDGEHCQGVFPVLTADGALTGAVVAEILTPVPVDGPLLTRPPLRGDAAAVVLRRDALTGQVTARGRRDAPRLPAEVPAAEAAAKPHPAAA